MMDKTMNLASCDRLFIASNYNEANPGGSNKELIRYEFFEILVRTAHLKFIATG